MDNDRSVKVWDPLVRIFHWTLVLAMATAYITEEEFLDVHTWAGYTVLGLLMVRILWGLADTRHARFAAFIFPPAVVTGFIRDTLRFKAQRYLGHNPAAGVMILLLLGSLTTIVLTGIVTYGIEDNAGPLAHLHSMVGYRWGEVTAEMHEFLAGCVVLLVAVHVTGVLVESWINRENLILSMVTGYKNAPYRNEEPRSPE